MLWWYPLDCSGLAQCLGPSPVSRFRVSAVGSDPGRNFGAFISRIGGVLERFLKGFYSGTYKGLGFSLNN